ncbi:hypothetical protein C5E45_18065 [Nocardia nova]|uniref:Uncharacterized protein n=1 Tax=Nocardia nova TaxID=37330 RepID=A0A2S6ANE0_9NOCA|nr:DUF6223 family protein [Nocardia nova]PPJ23316.1 hypothetical protein C5E41_24935 [Nocardia nova]PPJ36729.1 hypothetical protein C5E45_18065 [Nocardia nova]
MSVLEVFTVPGTAPISVVAAGYELGVGRTVPSTAAVVGLISVIAGGLAVRSRRGGAGRARAVTAVLLGLAGAIVGGIHGANAAGGLGTGNGLAGAIFAVVLGLCGVVLGGFGLMRVRVE